MDIRQALISQALYDNCLDYLTGRSYNANQVKWWFNHINVNNNKLYFNGLEVIPQEKVTDYLKAKMNDPTLLATSRDRLFERVKNEVIGVSRRACDAFLKNCESWQLHARHLKPKVTHALSNTVYIPFRHWQMDLSELSQEYVYGGYYYLFNLVDLFTKRLISRPLKNKDAATVLASLQDIFTTEPKPKILQSDNGGEFKNELMTAYLKSIKVKQQFSKSHTPEAQGLIERTNGTLKRLIKSYVVLRQQELACYVTSTR